MTDRTLFDEAPVEKSDTTRKPGRPEKLESNVVALSARRAPAAADVEPAADEEGDDFNIADAMHRAQAFSGALSTLDFIEVSPADFRALLAEESAGMRDLYRAKLSNVLNKIDAILKGI